MNLSNLSDEELYRIASKGDVEAYNHLVSRLLKYSVGITINTLSQLSIRGYDMSEAQGIASQCILISLARYEYGSPLRAFYKKIYLRELCKSIEEFIDETNLRAGYELDESMYDGGRYSRSEFIGTVEEDARTSYELNELRVILNERHENEPKINQKQRKALMLKLQGYSIEEISKIMRISMSQVRRILEKDGEGTPLQEIKIKLK